MRDVAVRAGVSPKTVSNVVRGWPPVSPLTEQRVRAALEELGYRMNQSPKMMRTGRSGIVAVAVPWLDNPYFAELTSTIVRRAATFGLTVVVEQTDGLPERERMVLRGLPEQPVDGLIFSPYALGEEDLSAQPVVAPTVLLGERVSTRYRDHVAIDNVSAALELVTHLIRTGRQHIATIGHQSVGGGATARQRARGYELAMCAAERPVDPALQMSVGSFERAEGAAAMRRLLASGRTFDAVFCFSDLLALGAMHEVKAASLHVPDDVAIAGFDDIEEGRYADPALTTIRPDKEQIASIAVDLLISRLASDDHLPAREVCPPYALLVRGSTSPDIPAGVSSEHGRLNDKVQLPTSDGRCEPPPTIADVPLPGKSSTRVHRRVQTDGRDRNQ